MQFLVIAIFSLILGISAGSLLIYHMFLVAVNRTTLEQFDRHDSERRRQSHDQEIVNYDVGLGANLLQVQGSLPSLPYTHPYTSPVTRCSADDGTCGSCPYTRTRTKNNAIMVYTFPPGSLRCVSKSREGKAILVICTCCILSILSII